MPREDVSVDHYATLEIPYSATTEDIKKQFRKLALKYHPDRNPGREVEFNAKFQCIQAAHELLVDEARRKAYDRSRRHHSTTAKPYQAYSSSSYNESTTPTARKAPFSATSRSSWTSSARSEDGPSFQKTQWESASRAYGHNGSSAWRATQEKYHRDRGAWDSPRTPKKTRDNPYATTDGSHGKTFSNESKLRRDRLSTEKIPLRANFFADRNPREKEWMDDMPPRSTGGDSQQASGVWEAKSSSEEDIQKSSSFYAFTPRSRTKVDVMDESELRTDANISQKSERAYRATDPISSVDPISPPPTANFTRSQTMRDTKPASDLGTSHKSHGRRRSNSSAGAEGSDRRRFSYLFNEDGSRKPHRSSKHVEISSDQDDGEDDVLFKGRSTNPTNSSRQTQSTTTSRRNTLDRELNDLHIDNSYKNGTNPPHAERPRSYLHTQKTSEVNIDQPFRLFNNERVSAQEPTNGSQQSKSFSADDWHNVLNDGANLFAVPSTRRGQQSPRKMPGMPKIHTNFSSGSQPVNFSRPRATSGTTSETPKVTTDEEPITHDPTPESTDPASFRANVFVFQDWQKAFAESNPFDVKPVQASCTSSTSRTATRLRKGAGPKKPINLGLNNKNAVSDVSENIAIPSSVPYMDGKLNTTSEKERPSEPNDVAGVSAHIPSPMAMDIDTPRGSPAPIKPLHTEAKASSPENQSSLPGSEISQNPSSLNKSPISPIKGEFTAVSPLEPPDPFHPSETNSQTQKDDLSKVNVQPSKEQDRDSIDLGSLFNVEPISHPSSNGLDGHWSCVQDSLPFDSKASNFVEISTSPSPPKRPIQTPAAPTAPSTPLEYSSACYETYCAAMTVYQASWNEYNGKIISHMRARLETDMMRCAKNNGFATGSSSDLSSGVNMDMISTKKAILELQEDQDIRSQWDVATQNHLLALVRWKQYLAQVKLVHDL